MHWETFLEKIGSDTGSSVWTAGKFLSTEHSDGGASRVPDLKVRAADGRCSVARDNEEKSQILLNTFFPAPADSLPDFYEPSPPCPAVPDLPPLTERDVARVIGKLRPYKAPGPDGLPACVYKQGVDLLTPYLLPLFHASLTRGIYPDSWRVSRTVVLRKPGKPDYSAPKAYRPIALLNVVSKILSACIAERLNTLAERHGWLPAHHFGGKPGCNTTDAVHLAVKTIKDAWARGQVASALFLDVKGAFPHADPRRLATNMGRIGVPQPYITWMLTKLSGRTTILAFDDYQSPALEIRNGIDQGCPLSVIFYLLYNSPLIRVAAPKANELSLGYIDDVTFIVWGDTFEETHGKLADIMSRRGGALEWSASHNSTFELDKTACIDFTRRREPIPGSPGKTRRVTREDLAWGDNRVNTVPEHLFLGVLLDQELRWEPQVNRALARGTSWTLQLNRLAKSNYGLSPALTRKLYLSVAVPRFSYAVDIWFRPVTFLEGARSSGSVGAAHRLSRIQRIAALAILGGMRSSPSASLDAHARLLPMHLLLNLACARAAIRLASAPANHPLYTAVLRSARGRKAHRTPLHAILPLVGAHPSNIAKRTTPSVSVGPPSKAFPSKKAALRRAKLDSTFVQLYADGASSAAGTGAAAVLLEGSRLSMYTGVRLGEASQYSVLDAEIAAIRLAIHLARRTPLLDGAVIYSDSQQAIRLVDPAEGAPSQVLAGEVRQELRALRRRHGGTTVRLAWCPGHSGIRGSELADREAKEAARGKDFGGSVPDSFTACLPFPLDPEYLKRGLKPQYQAFAEWWWEDSTAGVKQRARYRRLEPGRFLDLVAGLPRRSAVLLYRLVSGHIPLQRHLWVVGQVESPTCPYCGRAPETVTHFLLYCPAHAAARHFYVNPQGRDALVLDLLLSSPRIYPALFQFISATGRFSP